MIFRSMRIMHKEREGTPTPSEGFMDSSCSVLFIVKPVTSTSQTSPTAADIAPVRPSKETLSCHPISQEILGGQDRAALVNLITTKMWNLQLLSRLAKGSYPVLAHKGTPAETFYLQLFEKNSDIFFILFYLKWYSLLPTPFKKKVLWLSASLNRY